MATFSVTAQIDQRAEAVRKALPQAFQQLDWPYESTAPNFYQLQIFYPDIAKHYHLLTKEDYDLLDISGSRRILSKFERIFSQGREKLVKSWSALSAFDKKAKDWVGQSNLVGFPEIVLFENESSTELHLTLRSLLNNRIETGLIFLVLKKCLEKEHQWNIQHAKTEQRGHIRQETPTAGEEAPAEAASIPAPADVPEPLKAFAQQQKQRLARNEINDCLEAIGQLYKEVEEKGTYISDFPVIQSEHQRLRKNILAGIISYQDAELQRNQINHRLLQLIDLLEEDPAVLQHFSKA